MKMKVNLAILSLVMVVSAFLTSCEKSDSETLFGNSLIFIPQATVSGGQNAHFLVPSGTNNFTYNFKVDTLGNTVNVLLGVSRSGLEAYSAYSVDITTQSDTINTLIANGKINLTASTIPVELLPEAAYTLPSVVAVPDGSYSANFKLAIKMDQLKTFAGKKVALCVVISNPTKYELNLRNSKVIVLIDVDALKLP